MPSDLNAAQLHVLRWVADGCPADVMPDGYAHRVTAAAVRSRGLITTKGHGSTWRAEITSKGREYLRNPPHPARKKQRRQAAKPSPAATPKSISPVPKPSEIPVPESLRGAHPLVRATREATAGQKPGSDGRITIRPRSGVAYFALSRPLLLRALRILQGIAGEAKRRGWTVEPYGGERYGARPGIAIVARGHHYPVEIHETTETLDFTEDEINAWRNEWSWNREERASQMPPAQRKRTQATGKLRLSLPNRYGGGERTGPKARAVRLKPNSSAPSASLKSGSRRMIEPLQKLHAAQPSASE